MRAVVQRVREADVTVEGSVTGAIERGLMVLLGVEDGDDESDARYMADKISGLRIFEDSDGKMNLSVKDVFGKILAVSQFTLLGDVRKGKRPSFSKAARPEEAAQALQIFYRSSIRRRYRSSRRNLSGRDDGEDLKRRSGDYSAGQ